MECHCWLAVDELRKYVLIPVFLDPKRGQAQPYRQETLSRLSVFCLYSGVLTFVGLALIPPMVDLL